MRCYIQNVSLHYFVVILNDPTFITGHIIFNNKNIYENITAGLITENNYH